jgi:acylphosphatase
MTADVQLTAVVAGRVQGVGFRWWTRARAYELGLRGTVRNLSDGRVEIVAVGPEERCRQLLEAVRGPLAPGRVRSVTDRWSSPDDNWRGFGIE